jgi:nucleoside-triphosphatase THEP1
MNRLYIVTGKIKSGKTTMLEEWCKGRDNVDGILSPVINDQRYLRHIHSGKTILLEAGEGTEDKNKIYIGNYIFDSKAFNWGNKILQKAFSNLPLWLIIDEIGPLELRGEGFEPLFTKILGEFNQYPLHLMLVVRDTILNKFIEHYNLQNKKINIFNFESNLSLSK